MSRRLFFSVLMLTVAVGACGKKSATTTTAAATTKATTTTAAPASSTTSTTIDPAKLKSDDPKAVALNAAILTADELKAGGFDVKEYTGGTPNGPLNLDGVVNAFGNAIYRDPLTQGQAQFGAYHAYEIVVPGQPQGPVVAVTAVKFASLDGAGVFLKNATQIATVVAGGKLTDHPGTQIGVNPGVVPECTASCTLRVMTTPQPPTEANVGSIVYQNGVYYLVAVVSAPGTISDDVVLKLMVGQDMKYQEAKAQLGF